MSRASKAKSAKPSTQKRHGLFKRSHAKPVNKKKRALIITASIMAVLGIAAASAYWVVASSFNEVKKVSIEADPQLKRPAVKKHEAVNILLLGSDSRKSMGGDPNLTGFRSDVIMVAQISPDGQDVTVMSIMRDNWVDIQGKGPAKINAAFSYGGLPLAVNTVENFIGARIDHVAIVDFESFKGLTDAVGGVTVQNAIPFNSAHGGFFNAGEINMNGTQALSYVRERYAFGDGDYQRVRNQQAFIRGLMSKVMSGETLSNPGRINQVFQSIKPYLIVDDGLNLQTLVALGIKSKSVRADSIQFFTSPNLGTGRSPDGQSIVVPDEAALPALREAFATGRLAEYLAAQQAPPPAPTTG